MEENELAQRARYVHYTVRIPVFWYRGGMRIAALPETPALTGALLGEENAPLCGLRLDALPGGGALSVENAYEERFFCLRLSEDTLVLCGPYCSDSFAAGDVDRLIRSLRLPLQKREQLAAHYADIPRFSDMHAYYTGMFLERTFLSESGLPAVQAALPSDEELARRFYQNTYRNRMQMYQHPPYFFEQEITRQIIAGDQEQAMQLLAELNRLTRATLADDPLRSLKNSLIASVTLFTRAAITGGVPSDEAFTMSDSFIQTIEKQADPRLLSSIEEAIIQRFIERVARYRRQRYSSLIRRTIAYIDEHLCEPLALETLAAHADVNPDYLGKRFRQETGEALHTHILRRRVEEAAHFMRYGGDSITDIAAFYRFSSQSHFTTVFRRFTGYTPQQYRRL